MKKRIFTYGSILALCATLVIGCSKSEEAAAPAAPAETPLMASKNPSNRVAVLEDFTGVRCGYCPDGHVRAKAVADANPGKFVILAVHAGSYANPAPGWANFTNSFGTAILAQANVVGFPGGTVSRLDASVLGVPRMYEDKGGPMAIGRGSWAAAAEAVMAMPSPVNIGAKASFDSKTRVLTIDMDAYYTADETAANNINVAFVQNKLMSKQSGASGMYEQNHVLRAMVSANFGDVVTDATTKGSIIRKQYLFPVPEDYNGTSADGGGAVVIENCKVVVFMTRGKLDILTAVEIPIEVK